MKDKDTSMVGVLMGTVAALVIILGGSAVIQTAGNIAEGIRARDWPQTTGRIVAVDTEVHHGEDSDSATTTVRYEYTVDGQVYHGTRIHPNCDSTNSAEHQKRLNALKDKGSPVTVYYYPKFPERSTLTVGLFGASIFSLALCLNTTFMGIGIALITLGLCNGRQSIVSAVKVID